jgi:hypothetical protein
MDDGIRMELDHLHTTIEQLHRTLYEQRLLIDLQKKEIETLKESHHLYEAKLIKIDEKVVKACNSIPQSPPIAPSYKDALKTGIPNITTSIIKEQEERKRRNKNLIIKDKDNIIPVDDVLPLLTSLGATNKDLTDATIRVISHKLPISSQNKATTWKSIIVTLPNIIDRYTIIAKLGNELRTSIFPKTISIGPDYTPSEAKEQYDLRNERNSLNKSRNEEDQVIFYYGIRRGKVVKILLPPQVPTI